MNKWGFLLLLFIVVSCTQQPEPLIAGKDSCYHCKMPVADTRFGAELITNKGRIYKFDDINCMILWKNQPENKDLKFNNVLVVNYFDKTDLLEAANAIFIKSADIRTPMNSGFAAFKSEENARKVLNEYGGDIFNWEKVVATYP
ncbi:MAG: nitrous oxide reductase accessory protein NosL [Bacteroidetes bacterium]|jgi:copper chaperone NosL|nr:nitrous oxide reductase accessory protein NosL [Bacteroidota bacterium]